MSTAKSVTALFIGSSGLRLISMSFTFVFGVFISRNLGPEQYGIYSYIISILALLMLPVEFGVPRLILREIAKLHANKNITEIGSVVNWARNSVFKVSAIIAFLVFIYAIYTGFTVEAKGLLFGLAFIVSVALCNVYSSALRGMQYIYLGQLPELIARPTVLLTLSFVMVLFFDVSDPIYLVIVTSCAAISSFIVAYFLYMKTGVHISRKSNYTYNHYYKSAFPMAMTEGVLVLRSSLLIIAVSVLLNDANTGIFKVAMSTLLIFTFPISVFNTIAAPLIARSFESKDVVTINGVLKRSVLINVCILFPMLILFVFFGEYIFSFVYGSAYRQSAEIFLFSAFSVAISSVGGLSSVVLNMSGNEKYVTKSSIISLVVFLVLIVPLTKYFGIFGSVTTFSLSLVVCHYDMWLKCKKVTGYDTSLLLVVRGLYVNK